MRTETDLCGQTRMHADRKQKYAEGELLHGMETEINRSIEQDKTTGQKRKVLCSDCCVGTNHIVLKSIACFESEIGYEEDGEPFQASPDFKEEFEIVQCLGCEKVSFRKFLEVEEGHPDHNYKELRVYPGIFSKRKEMENIWNLPNSVRNVYREVYGALREDFFILAGIGMRVLLESVCRDRNAEGSTLEKKINNLVAQKFLTIRDAQTLHAVRFLGNSSAHEIIAPKKDDLEIAFDIVETLLKNVYVLPRKLESLRKYKKEKC